MAADLHCPAAIRAQWLLNQIRDSLTAAHPQIAVIGSDHGSGASRLFVLVAGQEVVVSATWDKEEGTTHGPA